MLSPVTVQERGPPTVEVQPQVLRPSEALTMYDVIAAPPSSAGAVHDTVAEWLPGEAETPVAGAGALGPGVTLFERSDAGPVPRLLVAVTVKV